MKQLATLSLFFRYLIKHGLWRSLTFSSAFSGPSIYNPIPPTCPTPVYFLLLTGSPLNTKHFVCDHWVFPLCYYDVHSVAAGNFVCSARCSIPSICNSVWHVKWSSYLHRVFMLNGLVRWKGVVTQTQYLSNASSKLGTTVMTFKILIKYKNTAI